MEANDETPVPTVVHTGGCHCGAVRFECDAPAEAPITACNCSICSRTGYLHLILPRDRFRLVSGEDALTTYTFNTGVARHTFCRVCGIKSFYTPRSHPDGVSVNVRCLDPGTFRALETNALDGRNWERAVAERYGENRSAEDVGKG